MQISKSNDGVCEVQGCYAVAEEEMRVPVGQIGEITIVICRNCKPKFTIANNFCLEKMQNSSEEFLK
jgi:hypothetical protein